MLIHCFYRFKAKYHPEECDKRKSDHRAALKRRADIFHRLMQLNYIENVTCDLDKYDGLVRLLDAGNMELIYRDAFRAPPRGFSAKYCVYLQLLQLPVAQCPHI